MNWINIKNNQPPKYIPLLVCTKFLNDPAKLMEVTLTDRGWEYYTNGGERYLQDDCKVTHWIEIKLPIE